MMLKGALGGLAALICFSCWSMPANATMRYEGYSYGGFLECGPSEATCTDPIFGKEESFFFGKPFSFDFDSGSFTIGGLSRVLKGFGGGSGLVYNCIYPVYNNECQGTVSAGFDVNDGPLSGEISFWFHVWWPFKKKPPQFTDNFPVDGEDLFTTFNIVNNDTHTEFELYLIPTTIRTSDGDIAAPVPLPTALPLGLLAVGVLSFAGAVGRRHVG